MANRSAPSREVDTQHPLPGLLAPTLWFVESQTGSLDLWSAAGLTPPTAGESTCQPPPEHCECGGSWGIRGLVDAETGVAQQECTECSRARRLSRDGGIVDRSLRADLTRPTRAPARRPDGPSVRKRAEPGLSPCSRNSVGGTSASMAKGRLADPVASRLVYEDGLAGSGSTPHRPGQDWESPIPGEP